MNRQLVTLGIVFIFLSSLLIESSSSSSAFKTTHWSEDNNEPQEASYKIYENSIWSPEEDPNYQKGLAKLLKDRGAVVQARSIKADNFKPVRHTQKPSYMFSLPDLKKLVRNEIKIYGTMKSYLVEVETRLDKMKRLAILTFNF